MAYGVLRLSRLAFLVYFGMVGGVVVEVIVQKNMKSAHHVRCQVSG